MIWKFRRKDREEPVYIYILMEFQSRPDPTMSVRLMGYVSHFYQNLVLRYKLVDEALFSREELAALGTAVAELFSIERSRGWAEVFDSVKRLRLIILPDEDSLKRAFETWLQAVILPRLGLPEESAEPLTLEGFETVLADSIDRWNRELREEGIQEGLQEGLEKGTRQGEAKVLLRLLQRKFGPLPSGMEERVLSADGDRILSWADRVLTASDLDEVFRD